MQRLETLAGAGDLTPAATVLVPADGTAIATPNTTDATSGVSTQSCRGLDKA
jgi:hypothetical protein